MSALLNATTTYLEAEVLDVEPTSAGRLRVSRGRFRDKREVELDLTPLEGWLAEHPEAPPRRAAAGFATGVGAALRSPTDARAENLSFVDAAGGLAPVLECETFALGAEAAGLRPWLQPFTDGLVVAYVVDVDRGQLLLGERRVAAWGVSDDRITSGARSMLYHRTRDLPLEEHPSSTCAFYSAGDGHDAARATILRDLDYNRLRRGLWFALPARNLLMLRDATDDADAARAFLAAVEAEWDQAEHPISRRVYTYEDTRTPNPITLP